MSQRKKADSLIPKCKFCLQKFCVFVRGGQSTGIRFGIGTPVVGYRAIFLSPEKATHHKKIHFFQVLLKSADYLTLPQMGSLSYMASICTHSPECSATVTGFCLICKWELPQWGLLKTSVTACKTRRNTFSYPFGIFYV